MSENDSFRAWCVVSGAGVNLEQDGGGRLLHVIHVRVYDDRPEYAARFVLYEVNAGQQ